MALIGEAVKVSGVAMALVNTVAAAAACAAFSAVVFPASASDNVEGGRSLDNRRSGLEQQTREIQNISQSAGADIVARLGSRVITAAELDASIRMQLHDLDLARYELRLQQLKQLVQREGISATEVGSDDMSTEMLIYLQPPLPPRFDVGVGDNDILGSAGAPLTIIQFLDYQSPYSKRAQPLLLQLKDDYGPMLRLVARDNPLSFHRHARQAALAAECARAADAFWPYHDRLLQNQDSLDAARLASHAALLGLDQSSFSICLKDAATLAALEADVAAAARLGLRSSPVIFVNGLYHKGPPRYEAMARLLNLELVRLGILTEDVFRSSGLNDSPFLSAQRSTTSMSVTGTLLHDNPLKSSAVLLEQTEGITRSFQWGDTLPGGGRIVLVDRDKVFIERGGKLEFLTPADAASDREYPENAGTPAVKVDAVIRLHRADIQEALSRPQDLEAKLASGSLDLEGKRLLKLTDIEAGGLFDQLGLQERDVLMQVDGAWIHNQENALWEALQTRRTVTLTVMRKGFPKTFQYLVDDTPR